MRAAALLGIVLVASPAHAEELWELRVALGNDVFTELDPPIDDDGFTHDFDLAVRRMLAPEIVLGGSFRHRWITEVGGGRRWDLVELVATLERRWTSIVTASVRFGPTLGGNFGGRAMQDAWHRYSGTGRTLEEGLQSQYPGDRESGLLAGARGRAAWPPAAPAQLYAVLDGQLALGAGVSTVEAIAGGRVARRGRVEFAAHGELSVASYRVSDDNLALHGAYGVDGWAFAWRLGAEIAWSQYRFGYQYRANECGSGQPIGVIDFGARW